MLTDADIHVFVDLHELEPGWVWITSFGNEEETMPLSLIVSSEADESLQGGGRDEHNLGSRTLSLSVYFAVSWRSRMAAEPFRIQSGTVLTGVDGERCLTVNGFSI